MRQMISKLGSKLIRDEAGAEALEAAMVIGLLMACAVVVLQYCGIDVKGRFLSIMGIL